MSKGRRAMVEEAFHRLSGPSGNEELELDQVGRGFSYGTAFMSGAVKKRSRTAGMGVRGWDDHLQGPNGENVPVLYLGITVLIN